MIQRSIAVAIICLASAGCDKADDLSKCVRASEPTILLRQLALSPDQRHTLDLCLKNYSDFNRVLSRYPDYDFCMALYLNANVAVRECMDDKGYTFRDPDQMPGIGTCDYSAWRDPKCYSPDWQAKAEQVLKMLTQK